MKITLLTHGTRGDVQPFVLLGMRLKELGHKVTVGANENHQRLVEANGLRFVSLPINSQAFLDSEKGKQMLASGNANELLKSFSNLYHEHRDALNSRFIVACEGAEAIVAMHLTVDRAMCLSDKLRVPLALVHLFPLFETAEFPSILITTSELPFGFLNRATYKLIWTMWWQQNRKDIEEFRRYLGLPSSPAPTYIRSTRKGALCLNAFSTRVLPRPKDWAPELRITGYFRATTYFHENLGEKSPADLEQWLNAGPPPVFLGFGSMPVLDPQRFTDDAIRITKALKTRAVINADWKSKGRITQDTPDHIFFVDAVNHDWLLPKCAAAVHHGGAGTTSASLTAGLPTMVCSLFADQPWWGNRIEKLGVGCHVPFSKLDAPALLQGLRTLLNPTVRARAKALGRALESESDGAELATDLLVQWLQSQNR